MAKWLKVYGSSTDRLVNVEHVTRTMQANGNVYVEVAGNGRWNLVHEDSESNLDFAAVMASLGLSDQA